MLRLSKRSICGFLFSLCFYSGLVSANLLTNGSFEEPVIAGPWSRLTEIPGWNGSFDLHTDLPTADGRQLVDINQNSYGWIAQTFATIPGAEYQLSFSHGVNFYCQSSANFAVEIDGQELARFSTGRALQEKSLAFTASFPNTELKFTSLSAGCGATTIDKVVVTGNNSACGGDYSFILPVNKQQVNSTAPVEIAARVYRPCGGSGPYPLLVFMHGQHSSCVGPCNEGFDYLAQPLADAGFVVISIKVNLPGGTESSDLLRFTYGQDPSLTVMRGRLLLAHLEHWIGWTLPGLSCDNNADYCAPDSLAADGDGLRGLIDWTRVGLLGHSRGGEGVRAAYNLLNPAGRDIANMSASYLYDWQGALRPGIRAIFEIAPPDRTSEPYLIDANGVAWNVMLPVCDGDIEKLKGIMPFDRMLANGYADVPNRPKSAMTVWGANHAYFNSWLPAPESEASCSGAGNTPLSAQQQQQLAWIAVTEFFRAHVRDGVRPQLFNPLHRPLAWQQMAAITRVERSFSVTPHRDGHIVLHNFSNRGRIHAGGGARPEFDVDDLRNLDPGTEHDPGQQALAVAWSPASGGGSPPSLSIERTQEDLREFCSLDFRIARQPANDLNVAPATDFSLQLIYRDKSGPERSSKSLTLGNYLDLTGPAIGAMDDPHAVLQTVRIRLNDFELADLSRVRGLRLVFDGTPTGAIYLANMRFERACD